MEKKFMILSIVIVIAALIIGTVAYNYFSSRSDYTINTSVSNPLNKSPTGGPAIAKGKELCTITESKEEAEQIAKLYGIELVSFEYGVATFHTDKDPNAVISEGKARKYHELSINYLNDYTE